MKKNVIRKSYNGLVSAAAIVGFLSALLGFTLKRVTEYFETALFAYIKEWPVFLGSPFCRDYPDLFYKNVFVQRKKE